jgi:hypothetical protein
MKIITDNYTVKKVYDFPAFRRNIAVLRMVKPSISTGTLFPDFPDALAFFFPFLSSSLKISAIDSVCVSAD